MEHWLLVLLLIVVGLWLLKKLMPVFLIGLLFFAAFVCFLWKMAHEGWPDIRQ